MIHPKPKSDRWPDATEMQRPIGMFVLIMDGQFSHFDLSPLQVRAWQVAWAKKSKWYRQRVTKASDKVFDWAKDMEFDPGVPKPSKKAVYEMWLARGDGVIESVAV